MPTEDAPTTETELLQRRPISFRQDAFPRKWITADERVLFETRPSLLGIYWGRLALFLGFATLLLVDATYPMYLYSAGYWGFEAFLFLVPTGVVYLAWRGRAYALTNQRVLETSGLVSPTVEYARYDEVQNLTVGTGATGDLRFELGAPGGSKVGRAAAGRPKKVVWRSVPMAPQVYEFVQDAFRLAALQDAQKRVRADFIGRALRTRIVCEYCGGLIEFDPDKKSETKCPSCGAPVRLTA
jgi:hypothetical protein